MDLGTDRKQMIGGDEQIVYMKEVYFWKRGIGGASQAMRWKRACFRIYRLPETCYWISKMLFQICNSVHGHMGGARRWEETHHTFEFFYLPETFYWISKMLNQNLQLYTWTHVMI